MSMDHQTRRENLGLITSLRLSNTRSLQRLAQIIYPYLTLFYKYPWPYRDLDRLLSDSWYVYCLFLIFLFYVLHVT